MQIVKNELVSWDESSNLYKVHYLKKDINT